ncbi:MAG: thiamine biosynthesis protein ThiI [Halioglobus sp.]|jgi:thiamine biosynthesis protein ThiI
MLRNTGTGTNKLHIETAQTDEGELASLVEATRNIAGISYILEVQEHPLCEIDVIVKHVLPVYVRALVGKAFAVRCKNR